MNIFNAVGRYAQLRITELREGSHPNPLLKARIFEAAPKWIDWGKNIRLHHPEIWNETSPERRSDRR